MSKFINFIRSIVLWFPTAERVALLEDKLKSCEEIAKQLFSDKAHLAGLNDDLVKELSGYRERDKFVDYGNVWFLRESLKGYFAGSDRNCLPYPFCPGCREVMSTAHNPHGFSPLIVCVRCHHECSFCKSELSEIVPRLASRISEEMPN